MFPESETGFTLQNSQGDVNASNSHAISFSGKEMCHSAGAQYHLAGSDPSGVTTINRASTEAPRITSGDRTPGSAPQARHSLHVAGSTVAQRRAAELVRIYDWLIPSRLQRAYLLWPLSPSW
jgi:hypothetical protein